MIELRRDQIFPEGDLPSSDEAIAHGKKAAGNVSIGSSAFLQAVNARSELEYKNRQAENRRIMQHAQLGYRSLDRTIEAARSIHHDVTEAGYKVDRYGICLDWSMGYPKADREGRPKGTGLILDDEQSFALLANAAPVAAHFGDFVIGFPSALENTAAALKAGSTSIGNLGQYFTFELPGWKDDVETTRATVAAIALAASQPEPVLIHSNIDDGFAARFTDLASALGAVMLEIYIVDDLLGARASHCYGHTFSDLLRRFAFQRALQRISRSPGTMVYGNTTSFGDNDAANYAALGAYLSVDIQAQLAAPSGHAINPVPITEALRIPDISEVIDAQIFCGKLIERSTGMDALLDTTEADVVADKLIVGAERFKSDVLGALKDADIDIENPLEMLLALRRVGAKNLEIMFGPGEVDPTGPNGRQPIEPSSVLIELSERAEASLSNITDEQRTEIVQAGLRVITATTDVHEYGKRLLDEILLHLDVTVIDGAVSTDPDALAESAKDADAIFLSTYNGVALDYIQSLRRELEMRGLDLPVFVGGKLNQVPSTSNTSLPVDVGKELTAEGAVVCRNVDDMYAPLAEIAHAKGRGSA